MTSCFKSISRSSISNYLFEPSMLAVKVDADVASLLDHCVRHVEEVHSPGRRVGVGDVGKSSGKVDGGDGGDGGGGGRQHQVWRGNRTVMVISIM